MTREEVLKIGITACRSTPSFIKTLKFDPTRSGLSTTEPAYTGVVLVEHPRNMADSASQKTYQDRSWAQYGSMGGITSDSDGNTYTAPLPKAEKTSSWSDMNKIYKLESETGDMSVLTELSKTDSTAGTYPMSVLGIYYDCHGKKLYATSVAGSNKNKENGVIYVIDPDDGDIVDKLEGYDAFAIFVGGFTGEKRLYFGSVRNSTVYSIELTKNGKFTGDVKEECSLKNLGPRGNDKAHNIRFDEKGYMMVYGIEFDYRLPVKGEDAETLYQFAYDKSAKKWLTVQGRQ